MSSYIALWMGPVLIAFVFYSAIKMMSFVGSSADVADPWYTGNFELTFSDIYKACKALLEQI